MNDTMMHVRVNVCVYMCVCHMLIQKKNAIVVIHYGPLKKKNKKKIKKIFCCYTLPIKSLPSSQYKPGWIILALTEHVIIGQLVCTALLPCQLCTPPMTALMEFHHKHPC